MSDLSFQKFAVTAKARAERWFPIKDWSGSDWATALAGEVGEVCDVIKKLNRADIGRPGKNDPSRAKLEAELGNELADVLTYAQLTAHRYGIDLAAALVKKFNAVSEREGFPERLELEAELEPELIAEDSLRALPKQTAFLHLIKEDLTPPMTPPTAHPDELRLGIFPGLEMAARPNIEPTPGLEAVASNRPHLTKKLSLRKVLRKKK